mmetsp:Transcript_43603/g.100513  ORF Transcript_43603/g.100513 Transcript_43603/m.100513 type:complete len:759 (-) Transcript_43603:55-2331(-)
MALRLISIAALWIFGSGVEFEILESDDPEQTEIVNDAEEPLCQDADETAWCGPGQFYRAIAWNRVQCEAAGCCYSETSFAGFSQVTPQCHRPKTWPVCQEYISLENRLDCGWDGITRDECEQQRGCCWGPNNSSHPWCYFGSPYWRPTAPYICNARSRVRVEAGYYGINRKECESRGACWDEERFYEVQDAPDAQSMCYLPQPLDKCNVDVANRVDCGAAASAHQCIARGCCPWQGEDDENDNGPRCFVAIGSEAPEPRWLEYSEPDDIVWTEVNSTPMKAARGAAEVEAFGSSGSTRCPSTPVTTTQSLSCEEFEIAWQRTALVYDRLGGRCNDRSCTRADFAGCILRMAGHDFMDFYNSSIGGADGCIDLSDPDNLGLQDCLLDDKDVLEVPAYGLLRAWHTKHSDYKDKPAPCEFMSFADFVVMAAEVVIDRSRPTVKFDGAPTKKLFRNGDGHRKFTYGRTTKDTCAVSEANRMPDPEQGCIENSRVFVHNMGLSFEETVAMLGVHSLGRCRLENSGFEGAWEGAPDIKVLDTTYYRSMIANGWRREKTPANRTQWRRSDEDAPEASDRRIHEIMLDTDLCLTFDEYIQYHDAMDPNGPYRQVPLKTRADEEQLCDCAWTAPLFPESLPPTKAPYSIIPSLEPRGEKFCGVDLDDVEFRFLPDKRHCCSDGRDESELDEEGLQAIRDCGGNPTLEAGVGGPTELRSGWRPETALAVAQMATEDDVFVMHFATAWAKATTNGYTTLQTATCDVLF